VVALPSHQLVYADEVGQAHLRLRFKSGDGAIVNGIAFRSIGQKLGHALTAESRAAVACGGIARGRSLAGQRARAVARARRRGAGSRAGGDQVNLNDQISFKKWGAEMTGQVQARSRW
jgi:hypothetical protein